MNDEVDRADTAGSPRLSAISGIVAALAGVSGAELVSIIDTGGPSPLSAVGDVFIDTIGVRVKDIAVAIFGTNHRTALVIAMLLVIGALGAGVGRLHRRSVPRARVAVLFVAVLGLLAFWSRPDATWWVGGGQHRPRCRHLGRLPFRLVSTLGAASSGGRADSRYRNG